MNAALYARVSSDRQDVDLSISAQLKALRDYAEQQGYRVVKEYVDEAESGRSAHRPQFQCMVADVRRDTTPFDALLVWKYSRFARSREDSIVYKTLLRKNDVQVISITEPSDDSPTGRLLEAIIESLDEFYSANLAQEIVRGMRESASRGFLVHSGTPYGYRRIKVKDGKTQRATLEIDPQTAPTVQRIFRSALKGEGLKGIAKALNADGIASPGGKRWGTATLHKVLTNEAYTGTLVWGLSSRSTNDLPPLRVEGSWPAIVDLETLEQVKAGLKVRSPKVANPRRVGSTHLLSGLACCGRCGKALTGAKAKSGKYSYYVCGTLLHQGSGACDARYLNARWFESFVIDQIKERILIPENLEELVRLVNEEMDGTSEARHQELEAIDGELAGVARRLERHYDALETGTLSVEDLGPRIQNLRHRQDQLRGAQEEMRRSLSKPEAELADLSLVTDYARELGEVLSLGTLVERKGFIRSFVQEVRVTGSEATIRYTLPVPLDDAGDEYPKVLDSIYCGGAGGDRTLYLFNAIEALSRVSYSPIFAVYWARSQV